MTTAPAAAAAGSGRQRRFTAKRALEMLQNLPDTYSGSDESQTDDDDDNSSVHFSQASSEDDDDNDDDEVASESDAGGATSSVTVAGARLTEAADGQTVSKDGTKWTVVTQIAVTGRFEAQNVFTGKLGPTAYSRTITRPVDAFRLLVDEGMLRHIKCCKHSRIRSDKAANMGYD